tara:strand:- start:77025 stop:78803 length:1779 start_codon:yes stop_codon:yes gene_type:complete
MPEIQKNHSRIQPWLLAIALASTACGATVGDGNTDGGGNADIDASTGERVLQSISITPENAILEMDLGVGLAQEFTATGNFSDSTSEDLTASVSWTVENSAVGTMLGAVLDVPAFATASAEVSKITAEFEGLSGVAQLTVVAYQQTGPQQDFFFVLPHEDAAGPQDKPLAFGTDVPAADVFFLMDTTGSMGGEIGNLQNALNTTVVPGIQAQIADTQFGAGVAEDFPVSPYGSLVAFDDCFSGSNNPDQPFKLFQEITNDIAAVTIAVDAMSTPSGSPIGCGNDLAESNIEGLYQAATGAGLSGPGATSVAANTSGIGGVGFRDGTMPIIVQITDAFSHAPGESTFCPTVGDDNGYEGVVAAAAHTRAETKLALDNICGRVVGIAPVGGGLDPICEGQGDLEDFATSTNARVPPQAWDVPSRPSGCAVGQCCTDFNGTGRAPDGDGLCPLVFRVDSSGTGLGGHAVTGINMLTRFATFDVNTETAGETESTTGTPLASGTTAQFIKSITPVAFTLPQAPPTLPDPSFNATEFQDVTPGTIVEFDVRAFNDFVPATTEAQIFKAAIRVVAGGCTDLDERDVLILVPPKPLVID